MDEPETHKRQSVHFSLPREIAEQLHATAASAGCSTGAVVQAALEYAFDNAEGLDAYLSDRWLEPPTEHATNRGRVSAFPPESVRIKRAAELLGVSTGWLRFGERLGSLPPARRTRGGQRYYTEEDLQRLSQIGIGKGKSKHTER